MVQVCLDCLLWQFKGLFALVADLRRSTNDRSIAHRNDDASTDQENGKEQYRQFHYRALV